MGYCFDAGPTTKRVNHQNTDRGLDRSLEDQGRSAENMIDHELLAYKIMVIKGNELVIKYLKILAKYSGKLILVVHHFLVALVSARCKQILSCNKGNSL